MGQKNWPAAEQWFGQSMAAYPLSSSLYEIWADLKVIVGAPAEADLMRQQARTNSLHFENFAEVAMLYFELSWRDGQGLKRSKYANPSGLRMLQNAGK
jgi:hypothetical protein